MPSSSAQLERISKDAATKLILGAAIILGLSFLLVQTTIWTGLQPAEKEAFYDTLPDIDLSGLSPLRSRTVLQRLNVQRCPCDCTRTVASCRNHHRSCSLSLAIARKAVEVARRPTP
jgi:hypothetical protein